MYKHIMKKIIVLALVSAMLFFSCRDDEAQPAAQYPDPAMDAVQLQAAGPQTPGFSLLVNANFYLLEGDDTGDEYARVRWVSPTMSLGEPVLIGGEARQMTFHATPEHRDYGRRFNFIETRRQTGPSGFAFPHQVAAGELAVVSDEMATLFTGPRLVDLTGTILSRGTVVVYDPETMTGGFVRVRGFDYERNAFVAAGAGYVRSDALSRRETDVQSAILLRTALQVPPAQYLRRELLLEAALVEHPDSVFHANIFEALHPSAEAPAPEEYADDPDPEAAYGNGESYELLAYP